MGQHQPGLEPGSAPFDLCDLEAPKPPEMSSAHLRNGENTNAYFMESPRGLETCLQVSTSVCWEPHNLVGDAAGSRTRTGGGPRLESSRVLGTCFCRTAWLSRRGANGRAWVAQAGGGAHLRSCKRLGCQEQRGSVPSCRNHNKGRVHISLCLLTNPVPPRVALCDRVCTAPPKNCE